MASKKIVTMAVTKEDSYSGSNKKDSYSGSNKKGSGSKVVVVR